MATLDPICILVKSVRYSRILRKLVSGGNRWVAKVFGVIAILLAYLSAFTDHMNFWTIHGDATRWAGIPVSLSGT
jgi:hypothetical protein